MRRIRAALIAGVLLALACGSIAPGAVAKVIAGVEPDIWHGHHGAAMARIANLPYQGGPVMHSNRTHLIFWQPAGSGLGFDPGYQAQFESFLSRVAQDSHKTTNVYSLTGQYRDSEGAAVYNSVYGGGVLDSDSLPANNCTEPLAPPLDTGPGWSVCLTDEQLMSEIRHLTAVDHLPVSSRDIYFLVLPNGFGTCNGVAAPGCALGGKNDTGSFCGYHSSDPEGQLLYAVIPYNAVSGHCQSDFPRPNGSTADPGLSTISHEHNEVITDPVGNGWIDSSSNENGDLCIDMSTFAAPVLGGSGASSYDQVIAGGHYWLQEEWSNADHTCRAQAAPDSVWFASPRSARAHRPVTFTAHAGAGRGRITAYTWAFGRHASGRGRVTTHTFTRAGSYRVTLRITDSYGNWAFATHTIMVRGLRRTHRR